MFFLESRSGPGATRRAGQGPCGPTRAYLGLPDLAPCDQFKVQIGNARMTFVASLVQLCRCLWIPLVLIILVVLGCGWHRLCGGALQPTAPYLILTSACGAYSGGSECDSQLFSLTSL